MKTILITGNSGYIGSHLTKRLSGSFRIIGIDENEPKVAIDEHLNIDIREVKSLPYEIDTIIHLAARVKVNESVKNPVEYYSTNLNGTTNLINHIPCRHFIFASTGAAEHCNSPYAVSKRAAEDCVANLCTQLHQDYTIFRFYNVIGSSGFLPTNPDGLFANLINATKTKKFTVHGTDYDTRDGSAERDYVHVNEICNSIVSAINEPSCRIENLGHGKGSTVLEIVNLFKAVNDVDFELEFGPRRSGDLERSVLDNPSRYMKQQYNTKQLLHLPKKAI